jgi:hypothetical protein
VVKSSHLLFNAKIRLDLNPRFFYRASDFDVCGLLGFPRSELGPAVISRIGAKSGDYYENTYPRSDPLLSDVHLTQIIIRKIHPVLIVRRCSDGVEPAPDAG